jgi:hypothetical protein
MAIQIPRGRKKLCGIMMLREVELLLVMKRLDSHLVIGARR